MSGRTPLKRTLNLFQLVLYGLGTTIGAGIYALVGELAGISGYYAPAAFLVASFMAALTALSFAELSGRYPRCAGAALYVEKGFSSERLSTLVGLLVVTAGLVSSAAIINGFIAYLAEFVELDRIPAIILVTLLIGVIAAWGIAESVSIAAFVTLVEIGGLLLIISVSHAGLAELPERWHELVPPLNAGSWHAIYAGSLLAFYAFIGFEDMVEVAEETRHVRRNLPVGIILTLAITALLYMAIMSTAVIAMEPGELAESPVPLVSLYQHYTGGDGKVISIIGLFALINGALIQLIMASRVLYGMSSRKLIPAVISTVNKRTRTPLLATGLSTMAILLLAISGTLASLAEATSLIMLTVFALVNLSLLHVKRKHPDPQGLIVFPWIVPLLGFLVSTAFIVSEFVSLVNA
ncbi:MAG: amino acid permease [Gammaproteobacteria bacterium]|nr:amino acid permease [Gammaproteobacteria bacterium]